MSDEPISGGFGHGGPSDSSASHGDPGGYVIGQGGNGHAVDQSDPEFRAAMAELKILETSILLARAQFMRQAGITYDGLRDEYEILGYDRNITSKQYRDEYARGGLAGRIVDVFPDACWRGEVPMELVENDNPDTDTEFEKAWKKLETKHQINSKLKRVDRLARLSTYAVLLIGAAGNFEEELPKGSPDKLLYLMPFSGGGGPGSNSERMSAIDASCSIFEYETDGRSPRFGLAKTYQLKRTDFTSPALQRPVHWTRIIHVAEDLLEDEVFGQPALERVWNLLIDLRKVTGGGAEAFWLRANAGMQFDIDKDMALPDATNTIAKLKEQIDAYRHRIDRFFRTKGVAINQLGSDVANFANPADAIITQIAGSRGIPKRILTGSEMGELASSQDRENFRDQVNGRQTQYCGPHIVRQLADRLIKYGYLPAPQKGPEAYTVRWPHIQVMTEDEKADGAQKWSQTTVGSEPVFTDSEIRDKWYGMEPLTDEQRKEIADRKAEALKLQQAAMAAQHPLEEDEEESAPPEDLRAAQRKFTSTQVQLPPVLAEALLAFGKSIQADDLCEEEGGLEDDPHVTVKYGIHTNDVSEVRRVLSSVTGPVRLTLGATNYFAAPDYDVLYVEVNSPDLQALNTKIADALEVTDTHPTYTPHATVAYLKRGFGQKWAGKTALAGMSASVSMVRCCPAEGRDTDIKLAAREVTGRFSPHDASQFPRVAEATEDVELLRVLTAAIECGNREVVDRVLGGPGSGNFGHAGRPGQIGGSAPSGEGGGGVDSSYLSKPASHYVPSRPNGLDTRERFSDGKGNYTPERAKLHDAIVEKYLRGTAPVDKPVATVLGGGMAAGKTTLVNAEGIGKANTVLVNVDEIRNDLPEYAADPATGKRPASTAFTHEEASDISKKMINAAIDSKRNMVLDGTGDSTLSKLGGKVAVMRAGGHEVRAEYVTVPLEEAMRRADARAAKIGRSVPPTVMREAHAAVSRIFPEAVRQGLFDKARVWDTSGSKPRLVASAVRRELKIHDEALWQAFLAKGKQ